MHYPLLIILVYLCIFILESYLMVPKNMIRTLQVDWLGM